MPISIITHLECSKTGDRFDIRGLHNLFSYAHFASKTGILPEQEGGAVLAAALSLKETGYLGADERIVLFNTGSGYKYREVMQEIYAKQKVLSQYYRKQFSSIRNLSEYFVTNTIKKFSKKAEKFFW